jgi:hypothetical protein
VLICRRTFCARGLTSICAETAKNHRKYLIPASGDKHGATGGPH